MEAKYKVGDIVILKKEYDPGCNKDDYPCGFVTKMLELPQKTAVVSMVIPIVGPILSVYKDRKMYTEPFKYYLKDIDWVWVDKMFEDASNEL